jgi:hypothetical protein
VLILRVEVVGGVRGGGEEEVVVVEGARLITAAAFCIVFFTEWRNPFCRCTVACDSEGEMGNTEEEASEERLDSDPNLV